MSAPTGLTGRLTITVHRGVDLKDVQIVGKQDPYAKLWIAKEKFKTKVARDGGRAPVWDQSFLFNLDERFQKDQDMIHFEVKNSNLTTDDNIGRADIKIGELLRGLKQKKMIQLVDHDNFTKQVGRLEITVDFEGKGLPADAATAAAVTPTQQPVAAQPASPVSPAPAPVAAQPAQPAVSPQPVQPVVSPQAQVQYVPAPMQPMQGQPMAQPQMVYVQQPMGQQPMMMQPQPMMQPMQPHYQQPMMGQPMMPHGYPHPHMPMAGQPMPMNPMNPMPQMAPHGLPAQVMDGRHAHPLNSMPSVYQGVYMCNGCGQEGRGQVYHCGLCDFDLHPHCVKQR